MNIKRRPIWFEPLVPYQNAYPTFEAGFIVLIINNFMLEECYMKLVRQSSVFLHFALIISFHNNVLEDLPFPVEASDDTQYSSKKGKQFHVHFNSISL